MPRCTTAIRFRARAFAGSVAGAVAVLATGVARAETPTDFDLRGPIRVGTGYSHLFHARVLSLSFEDEMSVVKLSEAVRLQLVFGMDGVRAPTYTPPGHDPVHPGFLGVTLGSGLLMRAAPEGPAFVFTATMGPLFEGQDELVPHGIGVAGRAEVFPFYLDVRELVECRKGAFYEYVLSGLSGWVLARQDWLGANAGSTYAVGFGVDLARNALMPILGAVFHDVCAK